MRTAITDSLAECARAYARETGLHREHPLWAAIEAYENARATARPYGHLNLEGIREHAKTCDRDMHPCKVLLAEVERLRATSPQEAKP